MKKIFKNLNLTFPFHPFFLAIFPVLFLYSHNIKELFINSTFLPLAVALALTSFLTIVLKIFMKDFKKVAAFVSLLLVLFFSYGHILTLVKNFELNLLGRSIDPNILVFYSWIVLFAVGGYLVARSQKNLTLVTIFLNVVSIALVSISLVNIVVFSLKEGQLPFSPSITAQEPKDSTSSPIQKRDRPDIYYLILDRYAAASVLKHDFDFDNSAFINFLEENGFYVAGEARANYPKTFLSLASSLNMRYLGDLSQKYPDSSDWAVVYPKIHNNKVINFLRSQGYEIIHFGDWWEPTRINKLADRNFNYYGTGITDEFANKLLETTFVYPLIRTENSWYDRVRNGHNYQFKELGKLASQPGPKFVFAHILLPHDPYVFKEDCTPNNEEITLGSEDEKKAYLAQLSCTNQKVESLVKTLLETSAQKPIIILQSDEGPFSEEFKGEVGGGVDWNKLSLDSLKAHLKILNAYLLPGESKKLLYPTITPVNSFRLIFSSYFEADFEPLPDKSYIFPDIDRPYTFIDVTDKLKER
ncbi:MAG: hypothetical protein A2Z42_03895 [Candidatus Woykebacteria bacterium RBG_19FT_COMBO_43_10]|uniref:Sulfatase N-terminal domain-containing protein n=1 Tax=Candidatus Woykebacteria bacterium RBG_19FT_COMBO_43_10 TaxID=1802598 RepID=A0A1G1WKJ6_9BACT|nr:MAG: hypothetical protein A2Z42_03895 [Candidatus Woykebacteria bacterium RBG_19FT_COMBO_43_10]